MPLGIKVIALCNTVVLVLILSWSFRYNYRLALVITDLGLVLFALSITATYLVAVGLWMLRVWARYAYIAHLSLSIAFTYFSGSLFNSKRQIVGMVIEIAVIAYLFLWPKAKAALR